LKYQLPAESKIAVLQEEQYKGLTLPKSTMIATIDLGLADGDVHFKSKQDCGQRFANADLGLVYNINTAYKNSIYKSMKVEGNKIRITFENSSKGLLTIDKASPNCFAISSTDNAFV